MHLLCACAAKKESPVIAPANGTPAITIDLHRIRQSGLPRIPLVGMKVVCASCEREGKPSYLGEREPY
jgi:hypothetical protein